jgi:hypothetical protein
MESKYRRNRGKIETINTQIINCISSNTITENIALNLILDVGQFYRQSTISNMRYRDESIAFWATVQKLFKRKQKQ